MLRKPSPQQTALEMVPLESLVPPDHLLRKIDAVIDFWFIHDRVSDLYCADNGRPALDPAVLFKALFIGYLFGIRLERQLVRPRVLIPNLIALAVSSKPLPLVYCAVLIALFRSAKELWSVRLRSMWRTAGSCGCT